MHFVIQSLEARMNKMIIHGDCVDVMEDLIKKKVRFESIVTDPPYELGFMGKDWDKSGIANSKYMWSLAFKLLQPGGHLLAFSSTRTYHRMAVAIEDAGFEIRDMISWLYGQGFPKSLDISKAIDKEAGVDREVVGSKLGMPGYSLNANDTEAHNRGAYNKFTDSNSK